MANKTSLIGTDYNSEFKSLLDTIKNNTVTNSSYLSSLLSYEKNYHLKPKMKQQQLYYRHNP